jgi:hypothetical protein
MGLTNWKNSPAGDVRKSDVSIAKNYLTAEELSQLNLMVDQYLSFAELQARQRKAMTMADWVKKTHDFLTLNDREILKDAGKVTHDLAKKLAEAQFEKYETKKRAFEAKNPVSDFDEAVKKMEDQRKPKPKRPRRK